MGQHQSTRRRVFSVSQCRDLEARAAGFFRFKGHVMTVDWTQLGVVLDRYGFSTVAFGIMLWIAVKAGQRIYADILLPVGKRHIEFIDSTAKTNDKIADTQSQLAATMESVASKVEMCVNSRNAPR